MALKVLKFWGGMKFSLDPVLQVDTTLRAMVTYVNQPPQVLRLPKIYWRTDISEKNLVPIGTEFYFTMPQGSSRIEFFVEYSTENIVEYNASEFDGAVNVVLTAEEYEPVFPGFGTRSYTFKVNRGDVRSYNYVQALTHTRTSLGANYYANGYRFSFREPLRRAMNMTLLDLAGNPLADNQNEALLAANDWEDPTIAGWPLFSNGNNLWGNSMNDNIGGVNMLPTAFGSTGNSLPVLFRPYDSITLAPGTAEVRLQRKYLKATLNNALNAAKIENPAITQLCDAFILDFEDAGSIKGAHIGRDNRFVPQTKMVITMNTDP